jgi:hypothetical protein
VLFLVVTVLVALFGYYSWTQLAIEAYPELSDVTAQVTTQVPGWRPKRSSSRSPRRLERGLGEHARRGDRALEQHLRAVADHADLSRTAPRTTSRASAFWSEWPR